jgi:threonine dehydratase
MTNKISESISKTDILAAAKNLEGVINPTPLEFNKRLSKKYNAEIYLKREDLQVVRSYKLRGAFNAISKLTNTQKRSGIVCASAGNHAQGVAYSGKLLNVKNVIYMPETTPSQKIEKVKYFGGELTEIRIEGRNFDDSKLLALKESSENGRVFIHPFDDFDVIAGQGTVANEVFEQMNDLDYIIAPVGGGGLLSGIGIYFEDNLKVKIIGVDQTGCPKLKAALENGKPIKVEDCDSFVDGCAVAKIGDKTFEIISRMCFELEMVGNGQISENMLEIFQGDGIILEPAGAVSIAALENLIDRIKNKKVVCICSGGNQDISRYAEIIERSLIHRGLKHYFIIEFVQRPGELKRFLDTTLDKSDDIVRFEYLKKTNRESGSALVGMQFTNSSNYNKFILNLNEKKINYKEITNDPILYSFII